MDEADTNARMKSLAILEGITDQDRLTEDSTPLLLGHGRAKYILRYLFLSCSDIALDIVCEHFRSKEIDDFDLSI